MVLSYSFLTTQLSAAAHLLGQDYISNLCGVTAILTLASPCFAVLLCLCLQPNAAAAAAPAAAATPTPGTAAAATPTGAPPGAVHATTTTTAAQLQPGAGELMLLFDQCLTIV